MTLRVSTTCNHDNVYLGFFGTCGYGSCVSRWADMRIRKNVKNITITKTAVWESLPGNSKGLEKFSYKGKCDSNTLTIHEVQLVKGFQNCLENRMYINKIKV